MYDTVFAHVAIIDRSANCSMCCRVGYVVYFSLRIHSQYLYCIYSSMN